MSYFLKGKKMWGYVSETYVIPKNTEEGDVILIDAWCCYSILDPTCWRRCIHFLNRV
jgi:hypothetical protein